VLGVRVEADGGWRISAGTSGMRVAEGRLSPAAVARLVAAVDEALGPGAVVHVPGRDAARTAAEEAAGRALAAAPCCTPEVAAAFAAAVVTGAAVVVDAPDAEVSRLPWELLSATAMDPPIEALGRAAVARLAGGGRARDREPGSHLAVAVWCPTSDPASERRAADLRQTLAASSLSPVDPDEAEVLHVVCHGARDLSGIVVWLERGEAAAGTLGHVLAHAVARVRLVVLDVCEGGAQATREVDGLAARLVAAGAPACVAPHGRVGLEAAAAFSRGLYAALAGGAPLGAGIAAGRTVVRALARPHADSRWANYRLYVGDALAVAQRLQQRGWRPPGWPAPRPAAAAWLLAACELAVNAGFSHVGVDHLALSLPASTPGRSAARLRFAVERCRAGLVSRLARLEPGPLGSPAATPRLDIAGARLDPGWDCEALCAALLLDIGPDLAVGLPQRGTRGFETLRSHGAGATRVPPDGLEVVSGPEDGRVLALAVGLVIGRAGPEGPDVALYSADGTHDPRLSRRHLVWEGDGEVTFVQPGRIATSDATEAAGAGQRVRLAVGDVLELGATRLRAIRRG
jgi:hypothetical protein